MRTVDMKGNTRTIIALSLTGAAVMGCIVFAVVDSARIRNEAAESDREMLRHEAALKNARQAVRESVRKRLQNEAVEAKAAKDAEATRLRNAATRLRRDAANRFFGLMGKHAVSEQYAKACEMPRTRPEESDQEIIDLADVAASEEDLDTAADVAAAALASHDPRARLAAVEMLSNLGDAGLLDISEFLRDPHPEVANLAADRWELGIQDLEDEVERTALVKVGLLAITDEDQLRSMVGTLQLVSDAALIVNTVIEVMRDGLPVQREAVKEAYEFETGEEWRGEAAAKKWLRENHAPTDPADIDWKSGF